ncbi:hypothetical protein [Roseburia hominis]|uniref:hypothetical protein n=1 Tax=Roseburia hominis TaxID=301301 RepID=UPI001C0361ED|nr:hypothetical protein [Roseburia hominis]MBT9667639.1 hypothetical protein [Roseburia hominis]
MGCEKECKLGKTYCCMECPSNDICREKRKNRKLSFEKAVKWIAVSIAVIAGIKMTGSAWCLWAFALPVMDLNFTADLKRATSDQIRIAIEKMQKNGGKNKTRIAACESELKRRDREHGK